MRGVGLDIPLQIKTPGRSETEPLLRLLEVFCKVFLALLANPGP